MRIQSNGVILEIDPELLAQMKDDGHPLVLSVDGEAELIVQDAVSYQKLLDELDQHQALAGIRRAIADMKAGRGTPLDQFEKEFRARHGIRYGLQRHPD